MASEKKSNAPSISAAATAAAAAIALAKTSSETAAALASAKIASDIASAVVATDINYIKRDILEIKEMIKAGKDVFLSVTEYTINHTALKDLVGDHESRIRTNETFIRYGLGFLAAIQAALVAYLALHK